MSNFITQAEVKDILNWTGTEYNERVNDWLPHMPKRVL